MIEDVFEHHVLGTDPFRIETLWRNVYGRGYSLRPDISLMGVLSGLEMALWDIVGKAIGQAGLRAARRQGAREAPQLHLSLSAADATLCDSPVYRDPESRPSGRSNMSRWASRP